VDSNSATAMSLIGGSVVGATYADITGGYSKSNNSTLDLDEGSPDTGVDPLPDPYKDLEVPSGTGCDYTNYKVTPSQTKTMSPGRYCGGVTIQGTAFMNAGNYIIVGGLFKVDGGATLTSAAAGVTIFLTGSGSDYAQVTINGGAIMNIIAATGGGYKGIAFFQDQKAPIKDSGAVNKFNGGSTMEIKGAIYIPRQKIEFTGGNTASGGCMRMIAYQIEFTGNSDVDSDCTGYDFPEETRRPPKLEE